MSNRTTGAIVRLRADDLPEGEEPSYKMVETPTEENGYAGAQPEKAKPERQQAAVQGITPAQPAPVSARDQEPAPAPAAAAPVAAAPAPSPVAAAPAQPGVMARLVGWVKSLFTTEVPATAPAPEPDPEPAPPPTGPVMRFLKYNRSYIRFYPPRIRQMLEIGRASCRERVSSPV